MIYSLQCDRCGHVGSGGGYWVHVSVNEGYDLCAVCVTDLVDFVKPRKDARPQ